MYSQITYAVANSVLTVTLNRPEVLNAFTRTMMDELIDAFRRADADDEVRAVILTGAGRAFCAGADLSLGAATFRSGPLAGETATSAAGDVDLSDPAIRDTAGRVTLAMFAGLKPVIAAINGPAVGVGLTMTLAADVRLLAQDAKIGFVFARRGIVPEGASAFFLPRLVGIGKALEWCLTGRLIPASEALDSGLVSGVHPADQVLAAANAIARDIVANVAPVSAALTRQMMWRGLAASHPMDAHRIDSRGVYIRGRSADASEGVTSFLEKRPPRFTDKVSTDLPSFYPWFDEPEYR